MSAVDDDVVAQDAIVVGAGHNGLVCAAYLARAGVRTLLVEARDSVGGCASTVDAVGARVNICNCEHVAVRSVPLVEELDLARHGLRYLDLDLTSVALSWTADRPAFFFHDVDRTLEALAVTHPDQVDGYRAYLRAALPVARLVVDLALDPPSAPNVARRLARRRASGLGTLLRWSRLSVAEVLRSYFTSETVMGAAIAAGPAVWGVSPHQRGTGLGVLRMAMGHVVQPGRPVGGSGALTDALRASFEAAGGTVVCGERVATLLLEGGRVRGVRTASGAEVLAPTVVVASDPRVAILEWLGDVPPALAPFVEGWRDRPAFDGYESKLDAVLSGPPRYRAIDDKLLRSVGVDEPLSPTAYVAPAVDGIAAAHRDGQAGHVASRPVFLANLPSVADPTMRPPGGGHVFSLEVLFTPYALRGGWAGSREPGRWLETYAGLVEDGFMASVQDWRAMTPDRYEAEFHLPRGYAQSFAGGPLAALLGRDPELTRYQTPLDGLYLTGAATFPGAGVWGAPGRNAAHVVLRAIGSRRAA
jgi:phytoene dehydrogenase-like protein